MIVEINEKKIDTNRINEIIVLNDNTSDCYEIHFQKNKEDKFFPYTHITEDEKVKFDKVLKQLVADETLVKGENCYYNVNNVVRIYFDVENENGKKQGISKIVYNDGYERKIPAKDSVELSSFVQDYEYGMNW